jgi:hypothetical protein
MPKKIWLELEVATNMDKSISIAGIKEVAGMGLMCFTPKAAT